MVEEMTVPIVEKLRVVDMRDDFVQMVATVSIERSETIHHGDVFPHFEGHQYRSLGTMRLIDGEKWKPNSRGVDILLVEVGVVPIEPDGSSFIRMRLPKSFLDAWVKATPDAFEPIVVDGHCRRVRPKKKKRKR